MNRNFRANHGKYEQRVQTQLGELINKIGRLLEEKRSLEVKAATQEQQLSEAQSKAAEASATPSVPDQSATIVCACLRIKACCNPFNCIM